MKCTVRTKKNRDGKFTWEIRGNLGDIISQGTTHKPFATPGAAERAAKSHASIIFCHSKTMLDEIERSIAYARVARRNLARGARKATPKKVSRRRGASAYSRAFDW